MVLEKPISVDEILAEFCEVVAYPCETIRKWKNENQKMIIGCFPMDIPEEIIHAAGMLPVVMWESQGPITQGNAHISPHNCAIIRSVIDDNVKGNLNFLDGVVSYETCLQARHLLFILKKTGQHDYYQRIFLPGVIGGNAARAFMKDNLERLKKSLEDLGNLTISRERIARSILVYNENRSLLRKLYEIRRKNPALLRAKEVSAIIQSSMLMPKEDHSRLLRILLKGLDVKAISLDQRKRVILSGSLCKAPDSFILDLIEETGMAVLDDDLFVGSRYFLNDAGVDDDPITALIDRHMNRISPSPELFDSKMEWAEYLKQMTAVNKASGVISLMVKYCPPHLAAYPDIETKLAGAGIHTLVLEMEHETTSIEQVRTRLQAFEESLETL